MKKIIYVGSKNPLKVQAAEDALSVLFPDNIFECIGVGAPSGVADQPMTDRETKEGALNRLCYIQNEYKDGDFWVAMEGGVEDLSGDLTSFAWVVVTNGHILGESRTATFVLPKKVRELVVELGMELGDADDVVFAKENSKQKDGAVGILTNGIESRATYYAHAMRLALIPFVRSDLYN